LTIDVILDLLLRWFHVIAGIMWIGNSMLFNWLDRNLVKKEGIDGEIWLLHSGAFYQVEKKQLEPNQMPPKVHWFMWQNFSTWISGIFLLMVVYYLGESAWLVDPEAGHPAFGHAVLAGVLTLILGWVFYDVLCRAFLRSRPVLTNLVFTAALIAVGWWLSQIMAPRAAYIHVGVLIGTLMTGNVWTVIIPSQRDLVAATRAGRPQDRSLSLKAKERSIHNNYLTFPLLFIMVSNHFPVFYGHRLNWMILAVLMLGSGAIRHFMNIRWTFSGWRWAAGSTLLATIATLVYLVSLPAHVSSDDDALAGPPVPFENVQALISTRCVPCHSGNPSDPLFPVAPSGILLETPAQIKAAARRIRVRVESRTMPFGNRTHMTDDERLLVVRWVAQGADLRAVAAPEPEVPPAVP